MKKTTWLFLLGILLGCAYDPMRDPVYLSYINYNNSLQNGVARGEVSQTEADRLSQQAYLQYVQIHESRRAAQAQTWNSIAERQQERNFQNQLLSNQRQALYNQQRSTQCTTRYSGNYAYTDCY